MTSSEPISLFDEVTQPPSSPVLSDSTTAEVKEPTSVDELEKSLEKGGWFSSKLTAATGAIFKSAPNPSTERPPSTIDRGPISSGSSAGASASASSSSSTLSDRTQRTAASSSDSRGTGTKDDGGLMSKFASKTAKTKAGVSSWLTSAVQSTSEAIKSESSSIPASVKRMGSSRDGGGSSSSSLSSSTKPEAIAARGITREMEAIMNEMESESVNVLSTPLPPSDDGSSSKKTKKKKKTSSSESGPIDGSHSVSSGFPSIPDSAGGGSSSSSSTAMMMEPPRVPRQLSDERYTQDQSSTVVGQIAEVEVPDTGPLPSHKRHDPVFDPKTSHRVRKAEQERRRQQAAKAAAASSSSSSTTTSDKSRSRTISGGRTIYSHKSSEKRRSLFEDYDWRTVVFIRHGKSRWNAAESSIIGKAAASAQGFWELYKHKRMAGKKEASAAASGGDSTGDDSMSDLNSDIMDAPLSREGILEALTLNSHLREYAYHATMSVHKDVISSAMVHLEASLTVLKALTNESGLVAVNTSDERTMFAAAMQRLQQCLKEVRKHGRHTDARLIRSASALHMLDEEDDLLGTEDLFVGGGGGSGGPTVSGGRGPGSSAYSSDDESDQTFRLAERGSLVKTVSSVPEGMEEDGDALLDSASGDDESHLNDDDDTVLPDLGSVRRSESAGAVVAAIESTSMTEGLSTKTTLDPSSMVGGSGGVSSVPSSKESSPSPGTRGEFGRLPIEDDWTEEERIFGNGQISRNYIARLLIGDIGNCGIVCSNLRRAISTALIGLSYRLVDCAFTSTAALSNRSNVTTTSSSAVSHHKTSSTVRRGHRHSRTMDSASKLMKLGINPLAQNNLMSADLMCELTEKVYVLSSLQEVGLNADTRTSMVGTSPCAIPSQSEVRSDILNERGIDMSDLYSKRLDLSEYNGDYSDKKSYQRLLEFVEWLFTQQKWRRVIVVGHSAWFQAFFKAFIPPYLVSEHDLAAPVRTTKIKNCNAVAFKIVKYTPKPQQSGGFAPSSSSSTTATTTATTVPTSTSSMSLDTGIDTAADTSADPLSSVAGGSPDSAHAVSDAGDAAEMSVSRSESHSVTASVSKASASPAGLPAGSASSSSSTTTTASTTVTGGESGSSSGTAAKMAKRYQSNWRYFIVPKSVTPFMDEVCEVKKGATKATSSSSAAVSSASTPTSSVTGGSSAKLRPKVPDSIPPAPPSGQMTSSSQSSSSVTTSSSMTAIKVDESSDLGDVPDMDDPHITAIARTVPDRLQRKMSRQWEQEEVMSVLGPTVSTPVTSDSARLSPRMIGSLDRNGAGSSSSSSSSSSSIMASGMSNSSSSTGIKSKLFSWFGSSSSAASSSTAVTTSQVSDTGGSESVAPSISSSSVPSKTDDESSVDLLTGEVIVGRASTMTMSGVAMAPNPLSSTKKGGGSGSSSSSSSSLMITQSEVSSTPDTLFDTVSTSVTPDPLDSAILATSSKDVSRKTEKGSESGSGTISTDWLSSYMGDS